MWGLLQKLRDWFHYYFVFSKAATFIFGLIFSHGLVEYAVSSVLIYYITDQWTTEHLPRAVAILNVQDGVSAVLVIVLAHISDAYTGRFQMVVFSTVAYIIGLVILWVGTLKPSKGLQIRIVYISVMLMALGKAGREAPLKAFLADQLRRRQGTVADEEQVEARRKVWWRLAWFSGAAVATFRLADGPGAYEFKISAIVMGIGFLLLWPGVLFYYRKNPTGSPLTTLYGVFKAAILKWNLDYPIYPTQFFKNHTSELLLLPHIPFFRWVDKAAVIKSASPVDEEEMRGKIYPVNEVKKVKFLLKTVPVWTTFFAFSLVVATGNTFFIEQSRDMRKDVIDLYVFQFTASILIFLTIKSFSSFTISYLYDLLVPKMWAGINQPQEKVVKITCGMVCCILCCITAWGVEVRRLRVVKAEEVLDRYYWEDAIPMSIFWLTPQFCLLGFMGGLAEDGFEDFFYNQVSDSMRSFGPPFLECAMGIGKFLSIPLIFALRSWFKDTLNQSHLDRYYIVLAIISLVNLCYFRYASSNYHVYQEAPAEEVDIVEMMEEGDVDVIITSPRSLSLGGSCPRSRSWNIGLQPFSPNGARLQPLRSKTFNF